MGLGGTFIFSAVKFLQNIAYQKLLQETQKIAVKPRNAFRGQSRSSNRYYSIW